MAGWLHACVHISFTHAPSIRTAHADELISRQPSDLHLPQAQGLVFPCRARGLSGRESRLNSHADRGPCSFIIEWTRCTAVWRSAVQGPARSISSRSRVQQGLVILHRNWPTEGCLSHATLANVQVLQLGEYGHAITRGYGAWLAEYAGVPHGCSTACLLQHSSRPGLNTCMRETRDDLESSFDRRVFAYNLSSPIGSRADRGMPRWTGSPRPSRPIPTQPTTCIGGRDSRLACAPLRFVHRGCRATRPASASSASSSSPSPSGSPVSPLDHLTT